MKTIRSHIIFRELLIFSKYKLCMLPMCNVLDLLEKALFQRAMKRGILLHQRRNGTLFTCQIASLVDGMTTYCIQDNSFTFYLAISNGS